MGLLNYAIKAAPEVAEQGTAIASALTGLLKRRGIDENIAKGAVKLNSDIRAHDVPGMSIDDPTGTLKGPQFQSDDQAAHILRIALGSDSFAKMISKQFGLSSDDLDKYLIGNLSHDAGKLNVPISVLNRTKPPYNNPDINFPNVESKLPTPEELESYPDGPYKTLMQQFHAINPGEFKFKGGNFTGNDIDHMNRHAIDSVDGKRATPTC